MSNGGKNFLQPKGSADQNVPQHQEISFEVVKRFMGAIVFTRTPLLILSDYKYSRVEQAWKLSIDA